jgi:hypothetical protein
MAEGAIKKTIPSAVTNCGFCEIHHAVFATLANPHRKPFLRDIEVFQAQFLDFP